jgi:hypothetical protein
MILNAQSFQDAVNSELARRKQEISNLKLAIDSSPSGKSELRTAGLAFFYAHWEGQVKWLCEKSLEYVIAQRKPCKKLAVSFQAMAIHQKLKSGNPESEKTKRKYVFKAICASHSDVLDNEFAYKNVDDWRETDGNLQTKQLKAIFDLFSITENLHRYSNDWLCTFVGRRNGIAHGDVIDIDKVIFDEARDRVVVLIDWVSEVFVNYVEQEKFLLCATFPHE